MVWPKRRPGGAVLKIARANNRETEIYMIFRPVGIADRAAIKRGRMDRAGMSPGRALDRRVSVGREWRRNASNWRTRWTGAGSISLDPLVGLNDASKPLRSRLLSVPALRERYLQNVREIAQKHLDWKTLGPIVSEYVALIEPEVEADTKKLSTVAAFRQAVADETAAGDAGRGRRMSLRQFVDQRREFLLKHEAIRELGP